MFRSALIEALKTFSKQEIKEFGLFIKSPFFNTNQSVIKLYKQIKNLYPGFEEDQLNKKFLFEKTFGKIKYKDSFLRMTVFRCLELVKEFLIYKNLQRNNLMKETFLLDELNGRELINLLMKSISDLEKKIEKQKIKEGEAYFAKFKLEYFKNEVKARDTTMITYKDALDEDLMLEQKYLNTFYFINSLKFFQYFLNQKNFVVNAEGFPDFVNIILNYLKKNQDYLSVSAIKVYYNLVLMLTTKDDKYFFELKEILFEEKEDLNREGKFNLIAVLRNYGQQRFNAGSIEFGTIIFDILKFSIEKDLLSPLPGGRYMSEIRFMNIAWSALRENEFEWLQSFVSKYIRRIEPDKRKYVLAYTTAGLDFEMGKFSEALEKLGKSGSIKNVYYKAAIKQLTLMIYYELQWFAPAADLLNAYRHFLRIDKLLPEIYITKCSSFVDHYHRLLKINFNTEKNNFDISALISDLKSTPQNWLLKKAQELESK